MTLAIAPGNQPSRWQQLQQGFARISVYLVDDALIDAWAHISATGKRQGHPIGRLDRGDGLAARFAAGNA